MEISTESQQKGSGGVGQDDTDLAQKQPLFVGHDQKLKSAAQTVVITDHGSYLDDVRRDRDGKLQRNNFAYLQLAAKGRADAIHAEFAGSAPVGGRLAFAKHRHLNARIESTTGETAQPTTSFGRGLFVVVQFSFSILRYRFESLLLIVLQSKFTLNGIKGHVPMKRTHAIGSSAAFFNVALPSFSVECFPSEPIRKSCPENHCR